MRNKYNSVKTGKYASKKESRRAAELKMLEKAGIISDLKEQVAFELAPGVKIIGNQRATPPLRYYADFTYIEDGKLIINDCKGVLTDVYRVKRHLMKSVLGLDILET